MAEQQQETPADVIDERRKEDAYPHTAPLDPGRRAGRWVSRNDTRLEKTIELLEANLGIPDHPGKRNALQVLVVTILSQNTTDPNALQAYENMLEEFPPSSGSGGDGEELPRNEDGSIDSVKLRMSQVADALPSPDWRAVQEAPPEVLEDCISVCGLQQSKAATIQRALEWLDEREGSYDLEGLLGDQQPYEAARTLSDIKGIGIKTAAVTLMEADEMDVCPVDTHVHRICQRLRLVEETSSRKKTFRDLQPLIPEGKGHSFHHNLLTFGRTVCTARDPDCENCFLQRICHYYRNEQHDEEMTLKFAGET